MRVTRNRDEISQSDLRKINESLVKFDNYIQQATRQPTNENIGLYEHWIDCMYDIQGVIVTEQDSKRSETK